MLQQLNARHPDSCPALVLNADFRPLSYFPLSLWSWQDTLKAVFLDRVDVVAEYDRVVRSANFEMRLPSVVSLRNFVDHKRAPAFTRFNVFLRDRFTCQYCLNNRCEQLTFDHVVPRSHGGRTSWTNIVAACAPCNLKKGGRTPKQAGMYPAQTPYKPNMYELNDRGRQFPPNHLHETWMDYLYWDVELEP